MMRRGFSLFTPMIGVVLVVISLLLAINMVARETSVSSIVTTKLQREKCVMQGDLIAVDDVNLYRTQSANVVYSLIENSLRTTQSLPLPKQGGVSGLEDSTGYTDRVVSEFQKSLEVRMKAGLGDLATLAAGLFGGGFGGCSMLSADTPDISEAVSVDRNDKTYLSVLVSQEKLDELDVHITVVDQMGSTMRVPLEIYGGRIRSELPVLNFMAASAAAIQEVSSRINKGYCQRTPSSICDPCDEISPRPYQASALDYEAFRQQVQSEVGAAAKQAAGEILEPGYEISCSIREVSRIYGGANVVSADNQNAWITLGIEDVVCTVSRDGEEMFKTSLANPLYFHHYDYVSRGPSFVDELSGKLSCQ